MGLPLTGTVMIVANLTIDMLLVKSLFYIVNGLGDFIIEVRSKLT